MIRVGEICTQRRKNREIAVYCICVLFAVPLFPPSLSDWIDSPFGFPRGAAVLGTSALASFFSFGCCILICSQFLSVSLYLQNPVFSLKNNNFSYYSVIIFMPVCFSFYLHLCLINKDHRKGEKKADLECDVFVFSTFYIILLFRMTGDIKVRARGALANATWWEKRCDQCVCNNTWTSIAFNTEWNQISSWAHMRCCMYVWDM